jgi:hypothetical protein
MEIHLDSLCASGGADARLCTAAGRDAPTSPNPKEIGNFNFLGVPTSTKVQQEHHYHLKLGNIPFMVKNYVVAD